jgi:hypothetical protein
MRLGYTAEPGKGGAVMLLDDVKRYAGETGASLSEKKGIWAFTRVLAERKAFLSRKKLTYTAKFRIDDAARIVKFTEMLAEAGSGLSSGGDSGEGSSGFGFKATTYKTGSGGIEGSITEQSKLFGKDYSYTFRYEEIREKFEVLATSAGYGFVYQITPMGL